ncbi:hypothetical protein K438DRAFT_1982273 [Mycena galopus ATCC 62051]|nr:hypothetical protein K438DRAFT_1983225 [Mycena galopus ATCC 62051]KAF8170992.1 hypothetical protein K438DRAFT_1982273 [Mycena galopus ATCC 62051]
MAEGSTSHTINTASADPLTAMAEPHPTQAPTTSSDQGGTEVHRPQHHVPPPFPILSFKPTSPAPVKQKKPTIGDRIGAIIDKIVHPVLGNRRGAIPRTASDGPARAPRGKII